MSNPDRPKDRDTAYAAGLVVPSEPRSVALVRQYAIDACVAYGWTDSANTVALLVSEMATNAILHAYGPDVRVRVLDQGVRLRVEVADGSPVRPVQRTAAGSAQGGRGLALVEALALGWGVDTWSDGKAVWFEIGI